MGRSWFLSYILATYLLLTSAQNALHPSGSISFPLWHTSNDPEIDLSDHDTRRFGFVAQQKFSTEPLQYFTVICAGLFYYNNPFVRHPIGQ